MSSEVAKVTTKSFGRRVRELRLEKGIRQHELAEAAGMDVTYLSKIETTKLPPPSAEKIEAIARRLNVDPDELLFLARKAPRGIITKAISREPSVIRFLREVPQMTKDEIDDLLRKRARRR